MAERTQGNYDKGMGLTSLVEFGIDTVDSRPIAQRLYNTPLGLRDRVDREIDWLLAQGYIRESDNQWASPMVTVKKSDSSACICVDFKRINSVTTPLPFYMPRVEEVLEQVGRSKVISKLDLSKGYYHVPKPTFPRPVLYTIAKNFEFVRMPFGIRNAPAVFQALMTQILADCKTFASPYMDDIIIYSDNWTDHKLHIREVPGRLKKAVLMANPAKCCWGGTTVEFLGHTVGKGIMTIPDKKHCSDTRYLQPREDCGPFGSNKFLQEVCRASGFRYSCLVPCNI